MKKIFILFAVAFIGFASCVESKQVMTVTVTNPLGLERAGEMIEVPMSDVVAKLKLADTAQIVVLDIAVEAGVFLAEGVFGVELVVAAVLAGEERHHVGAACGDAIAVVERDAFLLAAVHHAGSEYRAEASADIDQRRPVRGFRLCGYITALCVGALRFDRLGCTRVPCARIRVCRGLVTVVRRLHRHRRPLS